MHVHVVLVRPTRPVNVAAACRALKNMGLRSLRLVGRQPEFVDPAARGSAYGAWDVLDAATSHPSLEQAVADCSFVAGTTGRPLPDAWSPRRLAEYAGPRCGDGGLALVFGPEASGLRGDELSRCHVRVHIPSDPEHPSLNLAQAVLLLAYELRIAVRPAAPTPESPAVSAGDLESALAVLREGLLGIGYLGRENPEAILAELRRLLARAGPTARELSLLRGLARQVRWAGRRLAGVGRTEGQ